MLLTYRHGLCHNGQTQSTTNVTQVNTKDAVFSIRLKPGTLDALRSLAAAEERSVNGVIRRLLDRAVQPPGAGT